MERGGRSWIPAFWREVVNLPERNPVGTDFDLADEAVSHGFSGCAVEADVVSGPSCRELSASGC